MTASTLHAADSECGSRRPESGPARSGPAPPPAGRRRRQARARRRAWRRFGYRACSRSAAGRYGRPSTISSTRRPISSSAGRHDRLGAVADRHAVAPAKEGAEVAREREAGTGGTAATHSRTDPAYPGAQPLSRCALPQRPRRATMRDAGGGESRRTCGMLPPRHWTQANRRPAGRRPNSAEIEWLQRAAATHAQPDRSWRPARRQRDSAQSSSPAPAPRDRAHARG